jgi:hypothetical protein
MLITSPLNEGAVIKLGVYAPIQFLGEDWLFTASESFSETGEIVCCVIGIDFIDFDWSPRDL